MDKIINFLCSYEISALCNFLILVYSAILIKNILIFLQNIQFNTFKLFINITLLKIKEKAIILCIIFILLVIMYLLPTIANYSTYISDIRTVLLNVLTTIFIIDIFNSFEKIKMANFELTKNIFIEKCWNIFVTLDIKEKSKTEKQEKTNYYTKSPNTELTPTIYDKIKGFKTIYENENEYFIELLEKNLSDIEMLLKFVIPNLYKIAISQEFISKIGQFEFELLRLKEKYQISEIVNTTKKEDSINHLLLTIKSLWILLYKEQELFYNR